MVQNTSHQDVKVEVFDKVLRDDYLKTPKNKKKRKKGIRPKLVGSIDQGTSSTRFVVFTSKGNILAYAQSEHTQHYPNQGWHEHDPLEIWEKTVTCIAAVGHALTSHNVKLSCIGLTNQRETTVAWNRVTGVPYHYAIVWDDIRTSSIVHDIAQGDNNRLRPKTGLPLASYFAGTKVKWLIDNVPALKDDLQNKPKEVCFGTVDSWLLYQLTGTPSDAIGAANCAGIHRTDVTNASRWLFMDLEKCAWDQELVDSVCSPHKVPLDTLPEICPSSHAYGVCSSTTSKLPLILDNVPLSAVLGDQQAALFGQTAYHSGQAKNTYGTGLFLMMNTGNERVASTHGLLTTVAYQLESDGPVVYALEGSVSHSGSTIQWLRDALQIIPDAASSEAFAKETPSNEGCYLVPAFAGLFCPHWRDDARGCVVGLTAAHHKGHVCRAALEATAYQTYEVFQAMQADAGVKLTSLRVDGGGTHNNLMMQFQADVLGVDVIQPTVMETTALGAAFGAGLQVGVWKDLDALTQLWSVEKTYSPNMEASLADSNLNGWRKAVTKSLNWITDEDESSQESAVLVSEPSSPKIAKALEDKSGAELFSKVQREVSLPLQAKQKCGTEMEPDSDPEKASDKEVAPSKTKERASRSIFPVDQPEPASSNMKLTLLAAFAGAALGFALGKSRR